MKAKVQVRQYDNPTQIDVDLRLIEARIKKYVDSVSSLKQKDQKTYRKFVSASEFCSNAGASLRNIKTWVEHASFSEAGPSYLPSKVEVLTKKIDELEKALTKSSKRLCSSTREHRSIAASLKIHVDSHLSSVFDRTKTSAMALAKRESEEFTQVIQFEYSKPIKPSPYLFPRYFIRVHDNDGKFSLSTSCIGSHIYAGNSYSIANLEAALIFLHAHLEAQGLIPSKK